MHKREEKKYEATPDNKVLKTPVVTEDSDDKTLKIPLPDVTENPAKLAAAQRLMQPVHVEVEIPEHLTDALNMLIFAEPVFIDAEVWEDESITDWLKKSRSNPLTNEEIKDPTPQIDNRTKRQVNEFLDKYPDLRNSDQLYFPRSRIKKLIDFCIENNLAEIQRLYDLDKRLLSWTFDEFKEEECKAWNGKTILHLVCDRGSPGAIMLLLDLQEKRAEGLALLLLLKKDRAEKLPIQYAMQHNSDPILMRRLAAKMGKHLASVEPVFSTTTLDQKPRPMTAMHLAAMNDQTEVIQILLQNNADPNVEDYLGNRPLHYAAKFGAIAAVKALLAGGASAEVENDDGETPKGLGVESSQTEVATILSQLRKIDISGVIALFLQRMQTQQAALNRTLQQTLINDHLHHRQLGALLSSNPNKTVWKSSFQLLSFPQSRQSFIENFPLDPLAAKIELYFQSDDPSTRRRLGTCSSTILDLENWGDDGLFSVHNDHIVFWTKSTDGYSVAATARAPGESRWSAWSSLPHNGNMIAALDIGGVRIWDDKGHCSREWECGKHSSKILALVGSPDGRIISGHQDGSIMIWDEKGACKTLSKEDDSVRALAVLSNGHLVTGCDNTLIKIWDLQTNKCIVTLTSGGRAGWIYTFVVMPGDLLASGDANGFIRIWNWKQEKCIRVINAHAVSVLRLLILPNGYLLSSANDKRVKIWNEEYKCISTTIFQQLYTPIVLDKNDLIIAEETDIQSFKGSIILDCNFRFTLQAAGARLTSTERTLCIRTEKPCEPELKSLMSSLKILCPEQKEFRYTLAANNLTIYGLTNPSLHRDLEGLCQVFGALLISEPKFQLLDLPSTSSSVQLSSSSAASSSSSLFHHGPSSSSSSSSSNVSSLSPSTS